MPRSPSGRLVIDITPYEKQQLYVALARDNLTLKEWFRRRLAEYVDPGPQSALFTGDDQRRAYGIADKKENNE